MLEQRNTPQPEEQPEHPVGTEEYLEPLPIPMHAREVEPVRRRSLGRRLLGRLVRFTDNGEEQASDVDDALAPLDSHELASDEPMALSVSGNQLRQLSLVGGTVNEYADKLYDGRMSDARIGKKTDATSRQLERAVLVGDASGALKILSELPTAQGRKSQELVRALQSRERLVLNDVLDQTYDHDFLRFLGDSSRVQHHTEPPSNNATYIIPEIGMHAAINPTENTLEVAVKSNAWSEQVRLPLAEQHISWVDDSEVYGTSEESVAAHHAVFGELAKRSNRVFTHHTGVKNLPGFLTSESWGKSALRGPDAELHNLSGFYTEEAQLAEPAAYDNDDMPVLRADNSRDFTSAIYVHAEDTAPVILFSHDMPEHRQVHKNPIGIGIVGETQFDDPSLLGILVTPTYKANLLDWIGTWPQSKRDQIFKGRDPQTLLISSAADVA